MKKIKFIKLHPSIHDKWSISCINNEENIFINKNSRNGSDVDKTSELTLPQIKSVITEKISSIIKNKKNVNIELNRGFNYNIDNYEYRNNYNNIDDDSITNDDNLFELYKDE